jgi:hypothetical protein
MELVIPSVTLSMLVLDIRNENHGVVFGVLVMTSYKNAQLSSVMSVCPSELKNLRTAQEILVKFSIEGL